MDLCAHHKEITGHLEYRFELNGPGWKKRIDEYQQKAQNHQPRYVERQPGPSRQYFPTSKGKEILPGDLIEDIMDMLHEDNLVENNVLLLTLGISRLLKILEEEVREKEVDLDILLGIIASYADEIRGAIQGGNN